MATVGVDVIERAALGRSFQLGMLYDCRKDALIPGITLWDPEKLQQSLRSRPQMTTDFRVTSSDSIEDKSSLLNIDGSLKLSVLAGLVNVRGAAKYLNDTKTSFRQQRLTLHYHSTSRFEELPVNLLASDNVINAQVFDKDLATHVVTAVLYGADACFVFDSDVSADENKNTVEEDTKLALEKLRSISLNVNVDLNMSYAQKNAFRRFTCTFYGDVPLPSNPSSFEGALKVFGHLPKLLGEKKQLAVPLRAWLYPLNKLHSGASKPLKKIGVDLIIATESVIESLNAAEMRCGDLLKDPPALTFSAFRDKVLQMKQNCYKYKLKLVKSLGCLLPNVRGAVMKETSLNELMQEHEESPFRGADLTEWLEERERESDLIKSVLRQLKNAGAQAVVSVDVMLMDLQVENLVCFMFTSLNDTDALLLQQKACLSPSANGRNNENLPKTKLKSWLSPDVQKDMKSNLKTFTNLIDSKQRKHAWFIVSSREMESNPGSCILVYERECDDAVCFTPPSKPVRPVTEEVRDKDVVVKVSPACPATVQLRLLYKSSQDSLWKSKPVMTDQHTVTLTDLREGTKYQIKCEALGILNYTVYSDVTEVTTEESSSVSTGIDCEGDGHSTTLTSEGHSSPAVSESSQCSWRRSPDDQNIISSEQSNTSISDSSTEEATGRGEATRRSENLNVLKDPDVSSIELEPSVIIPESSTQGQSPVSSSKTFKLRLKKAFQYLNENPGKRQKLNDVFIEQHITEDPDSHISDERWIMRNDLFEGHHIRTVLLKGDAGTGKTVTVQKFILDWAEEKSNTDIDYIFPISFQTLSIIRETVKKCSFVEILQQCFEDAENLKLDDSDRILLIFDGLNEFKLPLDFTKNTRTITDIHDPASVCDLLTNLIVRNLLPSAQIWITSRPTAAKQIPDHFIDRVTEINGFDDQQKEEYFRKGISDQKMSDRVISHIQTSPRISSMCYLPDYCRIIAAIPQKMFCGYRDDFPKTLTQMYIRLLLDQTEPIPERKETIVALGRIAFHLLVNGNTLFCYEHLRKCGVRDESDLMRLLIIKKIEDKSKRRLLCFVNRRTQEFLAALYATELINVNNEVQLKDLSSLWLHYGVKCITDCALVEVMRRALERQMDLFFCFLLGLKLDASQQALKELLNRREYCSSSRQGGVEHIKEMITESFPANIDKCSLLFDALKELDERYLIQKIKTQLKSGLKPSPAQISDLVNLRE